MDPSNRSYNQTLFVWDDRKNSANVEKHGFNFIDAGLVYFHPDKFVIASPRGEELRRKDLALIEMLGTVLALVYVERGDHVRVISYRRASRSERNQFNREQDRLGTGQA